MLHHPRRRRSWTLTYQQQFCLLLLIITIESVVVIQHCNVAPLSQEAYRQLQHDWQSYALTQRDLNRSFIPNWRADGRCGPGWSARDGSVAICNPFGDSHCCSHWGWCGQTRRHCNPGVINPNNSTHEGEAWTLGKLLQVLGLQQDAFQALRVAAGAPFPEAVASGRPLQPAAAHVTLQRVCQLSSRVSLGKQLAQPTKDTAITEGHAHAAMRSRGSGLGVQRQQLLTHSSSTQPETSSLHDHRRLLASHIVHRQRHKLRQAEYFHQLRGGGTTAQLQAEQVAATSHHQEQHQHKHQAHGAQAEWRKAALQQWQDGQSVMDLASRAAASAAKRERAAGLTLGFEGSDTLAAVESRQQQYWAAIPPVHRVSWLSGLRGAGTNMKPPPQGPWARCNPRRWMHSAMHPVEPDGVMRHAASGASAAEGLEPGHHSGKLPAAQRLLVIYHYYEDTRSCPADEEVQLVRTNFAYFLRAAVKADDGADYLINLAGRVDTTLVSLVPPYSNVRIRLVDGETAGSDTCTFHRTLLQQGAAIFDRYTHFALINNGMRGPFVAAADEAAKQHWAAPFLGLLSRDVRLAGNYLSCELGVHLQGPFLVTDRVGVQIVMDTWGNGTCWGSHQADINRGEVGLSRAVLAAGYNIASIQPEYAGLDFRKVSWEYFRCRGKRNPTFCCGPPDLMQQRWVKHGGTVYRLGLLPAPWLRNVEELTLLSLAHLPPLRQTQIWQPILLEATHAWLSRVRENEGSSAWLNAARAFANVFDSSSHQSTRLSGVQDEGAVRYVAELAGDHSKSQEYRFALFPHMSGFDAAAGVPDAMPPEESDLVNGVHSTSKLREARYEE